MAGEIIQTLGFDANEAIQALQQLDTLLGNFARGLKASADAARDFNTAARTTSARYRSVRDAASKAATAVGNYNTAAAASAQTPMPQTPANVQALLAALAQVQQNLGGVATAAQAAQQALNKAATVSAAALAKTRKSSDRLSVSFQTMVRVVTTQLIVRAMSALRNAMEESLSTAIEFETRLAEIQTIGGPLAGSIEELATKMRMVSEEFNKPIEDVAAGYYDILSNQIGNAAESQTVLVESARLATAAVSSLKDAANALSSVINSYNMSAADAADISGKLFSAIELGRFRLSDIANTLGRVTTLSSAMGVSFEEVLASLATLTINGVKADEAMTLLSNSMRGLLKPTKLMRKAFAELGVVNAEAGVATYGFQGFLEKLRATTHGTASEIAQLTENIRVGRGVFGLTGDAAEKYAKNLEKIRESGGAKSAEKAQLILETNAQQVQKEMTKLRNFFIKDFGMEAIKIIKQLFDTFGGLVNIVKAFRDSLLFWGKFLVTLKAGIVLFQAMRWALTTNVTAMYALGAASRVAAAAMLTIPGAIVITALTAAWLAYSRNAEDAAEATKRASDDIRASLQDTHDAFVAQRNLQARLELNVAKQIKSGRIKDIELAYSQQLRYVADLQKLYLRDRNNAIEAQDEILDALKDQLKERLSLIGKLITTLEQKQKKSAQIIQKNQDEIQSLRLQGEERYVDRQLGRLKEQEQAELQLRRARLLSARASKAALTGDFKSAEDLLKTSDQRANAALELGEAQLKAAKTTKEQQKALSAIRTAESQVNVILEQRIKLREEENRQAQAQADAARREVDARRQQLRDAKLLIKEISKYEVIAKDASESFATREAAKKAITPLTEQLKHVLSRGDVSIEQFLGIEDLARKIRGQFDDVVTGRPVDLTFAYQDAVDNIFDTLEAHTVHLKAEIETLELSSGAKFSLAEGFEPITRAFVEQGKQLKEAVNQISNLPQLRGDLDNLVSAANNLQLDLGGLSQGLTSNVRRALETTNAQIQAAFNGQQNRLLEYIQVFAKAQDEFNRKAITVTGDTDLAATLSPERFKALPGEYRKTAAKFGELAGTLQSILETNAKVVEITKSEAAVVNKIAEASTAGRVADAQRMLITFQEAQAHAVESQGKLIRVVRELGPTGQAASKTAAADFKVELIPAIEATTKKVVKLKQEMAGIGSSASKVNQVQGYSTGGLVHKMQYFDAGGLARGVDRIPAMLGPEEFVVTAKNARRFLPELQAINAGIQPAFEPSNVTNTTTIGDIIVNGSGEPKTVAREIMNRIRREQRRGSARL